MVQEQGELFQTYNIGGHNEKQNIEIIHIILETLQEMLPDDDPRKAHVNTDLITYVEDRKGHDRRYAIAPDKIKSAIGWYPETMFRRHPPDDSVVLRARGVDEERDQRRLPEVLRRHVRKVRNCSEWGRIASFPFGAF